MPVPSPQQIQYLGSLDGQELTIQKQANMGLSDGPPHPMHPHPHPHGPMAQGGPQQGVLQGLGHPSEIPPLDMGPSLASENSQGSYHSSCSSNLEGGGPRIGPSIDGGPRFPSPPVPFDGRFAHETGPPFAYMDPRCRGNPSEVDPGDHGAHAGRFPVSSQQHHPGFPPQGGAFPGGHHPREFPGGGGTVEPMMGGAMPPGCFPLRPGFAAGGTGADVPPSPHIQSLQKMTPPFEAGGTKGADLSDPLNGPPHHRGSPLPPLEAGGPQFLGGVAGSPQGALPPRMGVPYPGMGPARNSPGPRARARGFAGNVQVKASAPNTIQYLPARPQNPVGPPQHRAPSLDFLQRFATPLTNLDAKVPTQNLQYFPPSGQRPVMMMRGGTPAQHPPGGSPYPNRGLHPGMEQQYPGGPNGPPTHHPPQQHVMPGVAMFPGTKGVPLQPGSPGDGEVSQPLPPTVGQAFSYKQGPFYGPTTADPNYAVQFHNFQQQLYATNTRSQGASGAAGAGSATGFFGPK